MKCECGMNFEMVPSDLSAHRTTCMYARLHDANLQIESMKKALRIALPGTIHVLTGHVYGPGPEQKLVEFVDGCARCRIESILEAK